MTMQQLLWQGVQELNKAGCRIRSWMPGICFWRYFI